MTNFINTSNKALRATAALFQSNIVGDPQCITQCSLYFASVRGPIRFLLRARRQRAEIKELLELDDQMSFTVDADLNCTAINDKFLEYFYLNERDIYEKEWMATSIAEEDRERVFAAWRSAVERKGAFNSVHTVTVRGGKRAKCRVRALPEVDEAGCLLGFTGHVYVLESA